MRCALRSPRSLGLPTATATGGCGSVEAAPRPVIRQYSVMQQIRLYNRSCAPLSTDTRQTRVLTDDHSCIRVARPQTTRSDSTGIHCNLPSSTTRGHPEVRCDRIPSQSYSYHDCRVHTIMYAAEDAGMTDRAAGEKWGSTETVVLARRWDAPTALGVAHTRAAHLCPCVAHSVPRICGVCELR
jgi:hypothetical protein